MTYVSLIQMTMFRRNASKTEAQFLIRGLKEYGKFIIRDIKGIWKKEFD